MVEIRRILCPIDYSDSSRHALEHAVAIAKWYDSEITALHVVYLGASATADSLRRVPQVCAADRSGPSGPGARATRMVGAGQSSRCEDRHPHRRWECGSRILDWAGSLRADLIVMGTHGLSGFERFMVGSVAEKVLRKASCPVMTVPPATVTAAKVPYTRLLCPVTSPSPPCALCDWPFSLAKESDAHLTILHALDWPPDDDLLLERFDAPELRHEVESQTRERLEALVTDEVRVWCKPITKISYGKPYRQILETAKSEASDLIVIGVRGRNALDLAMFGSTTNHVVRQAPCPVLTMRG